MRRMLAEASSSRDRQALPAAEQAAGRWRQGAEANQYHDGNGLDYASWRSRKPIIAAGRRCRGRCSYAGANESRRDSSIQVDDDAADASGASSFRRQATRASSSRQLGANPDLAAGFCLLSGDKTGILIRLVSTYGRHPSTLPAVGHRCRISSPSWLFHHKVAAGRRRYCSRGCCRAVTRGGSQCFARSAPSRFLAFDRAEAHAGRRMTR